MHTRFPAPPDFVSDGCTVPPILRRLYHRYAAACRWHDWARRHLVHHNVLTVPQADSAFYHYLRALGAWPIFGRLTWLAVKLTRDRYARTLPVPDRWASYLNPIDAQQGTAQ